MWELLVDALIALGLIKDRDNEGRLALVISVLGVLVLGAAVLGLAVLLNR